MKLIIITLSLFLKAFSTREGAKLFITLSHLLKGSRCCYLHFTVQETETQKVKIARQVLQLLSHDFSCCSDFQPVPSHSTHKPITKILQHTKKEIFFADLTEKTGVILIHSHQKTIVVLAVVIVLFDSLGEGGQCP